MSENEINDGSEPAFPTPGKAFAGLTIRDWFAGQAMQGLIAQAQGTALNSAPKLGAEFAYEMADAMIKERSNGDA